VEEFDRVRELKLGNIVYSGVIEVMLEFIKAKSVIDR
jgi:hypothetical protein